MSDEINKSVPSGGEQCPTCGSDSFRNIPWCYCPAIPFPHSADFTPQCKPCPDPWHDQPTPASQPDYCIKKRHSSRVCSKGTTGCAIKHPVSAEATKPQPICEICIRGLNHAAGENCPREEVAAPVPPTTILKQIAEQIIRKIGDASTELIITRNGLEDESLGENGMEMTIPEVKEDLFNVLMGHDTGCIDPEDLSAENCEVLWLENKLAELVRPESVLAPSQVKAEGAREWVEDWVTKKLGSYRPCGWPSFGSIRVDEAVEMVGFLQAEISRLTQERDESRGKQREFQRQCQSYQKVINEQSARNAWYGYYQAAMNLYGYEETKRKELEAANASLRKEQYELWKKFVHAVACMDRNCVICSADAKRLDENFAKAKRGEHVELITEFLALAKGDQP